jgi:hypothetical protein
MLVCWTVHYSVPPWTSWYCKTSSEYACTCFVHYYGRCWQAPHNTTSRTNTHAYFLPFTGRCRATERVEASGTLHNETGTRVGEGGTLRNFHRLSAASGRRLVHVRVPLRSRALHTFTATFLEIVPYLKLLSSEATPTARLVFHSVKYV